MKNEGRIEFHQKKLEVDRAVLAEAGKGPSENDGLYSEEWAARHNAEIWGAADWRSDGTGFYD
jgi:hypothetical protein